MATESTRARGLRAWFADNHKVALLASLLLVAAGFFSALSIPTEVFPAFRAGFVTATVEYRGASVAEVHDSVLLPLESAASGLRGVRTTRGFARPSVATLQLELEEGADAGRVAENLERALAGLDTLPSGADAPIVEIDPGTYPLLSVLVYGNAPPSTLRQTAADLRAALFASVPGARIELQANTIERLVDVPIATLQSFGVTAGEVGSLLEDVESRGGIGISEGDGSSRMAEVIQTSRAQSIDELASRRVSLADGTSIAIRDIAEIHERFAGPESDMTFKGLACVRLDIFNQAGTNPPDMSDRVHAAVAGYALPDGVHARIWADTSGEFSGRLGLVVENGLLGLGLVVLVLGLFVSPRVALWVAIGLPVVLLGSLAFWGTLGVSLNQMTLFALLLVLGIVVDDSIVVGEAIDSAQRSQRNDGYAAALAGVRDVWLPVVCAVATNMLAFVPLAFVPGELGVLFAQMATVVLFVLGLSLFESGYLLPGHLSRAEVRLPELLYAPSRFASNRLHWLGSRVIPPLVRFGVRRPLLISLAACGIVVLGLSPVLTGAVTWRFTPLIEADQVELSYVLPRPTSIEESRALARLAEYAASEAMRALEGDAESVGVLTSIGGSSGDPEDQSIDVPGPHRVLLAVDLGRAQQRAFSAAEFAAEWSRHAPIGPGLAVPQMNPYALGGGADELVFELAHNDVQTLDAATATLAHTLRSSEAVVSVDGDDGRVDSLRIHLNTAAPRLGVRNEAITRALGAAYFGHTVDRFAGADGEYEVRVRVRPSDLENESRRALLPIRAPASGDLLPLGLVAHLESADAETQIVRRDGRRIRAVVAIVDEAHPSAKLIEDELPEMLTAKHPGLRISLAGEAESEGRAVASIAKNTALAGLAMYALLVIPLRSFLQPLLLLGVMPIGLAGGVICHAAMGFEFSMVSVLGTVALCGVLINNGLLLLDAAAQIERDGTAPEEAVVQAAAKRFRPILLTTLTTSAGLAPLIFETDEQAQFLIPIALTLGGGLLVASPIMLLVLPGWWAVSSRLLRSPRQLAIRSPRSPA